MNPKPEKIQNGNPKHLVWNFLTFEHLKLFRISDFVLRIIPLMGTALIPSGLNQRDRLPPRYIGA
jgi:hypothetical protein